MVGQLIRAILGLFDSQDCADAPRQLPRRCGSRQAIVDPHLLSLLEPFGRVRRREKKELQMRSRRLGPYLGTELQGGTIGQLRVDDEQIVRQLAKPDAAVSDVPGFATFQSVSLKGGAAGKASFGGGRNDQAALAAGGERQIQGGPVYSFPPKGSTFGVLGDHARQLA